MNGLLLNVICAFTIANANPNIEKAQQTLDALYQNYAATNTCLLRENYPFDQDNKATYLASEEQAKRRNEYSYLWPYSGTFSAVNALLESTENKKYKKLLENKVLPGLEEYFDTRRKPFAYSSYISSQPLSDRFYDDNVWVGIDFTDSYRMTGKQAYLEKAKLIWKFILSGKDDVLGGGIYWCEQKKESKNTCSNAPGAVFALKLFQATQDDAYLKEGKELYEWTKKNLEDSKDHLYFDNISLNKKISDILSQVQFLAQLQQAGGVDPDTFISSNNKLSEQLRRLKQEKARLLDTDSDDLADQTHDLMDALADGPDFLDRFDAELFDALVEKIIVDSNERLRFRLKNGLELTEQIERTRR